jgi:hypothetical protein
MKQRAIRRWHRRNALKRDLIRKELRDQIFVERSQLIHIWRLGTLRIQVVFVEHVDPFEVFAILVIHQILILVFSVSRIERMKPQHVLSFQRHVVLCHLIDILIMAPGHAAEHTDECFYWAFETKEAQKRRVDRIICRYILSSNDGDFIAHTQRPT